MKIQRQLTLPDFDHRPANTQIDTLVLHSMYNPFATCQADKFMPEQCCQCLHHHHVSAHYLIARDGNTFELVAPNMRAWHAGASEHPIDGRTRLNDFSIGIELIATEDSGYTDEQYDAVSQLSHLLAQQFPISSIVGHVHIAPDRKSDPWQFDWSRFNQQLIEKNMGDLVPNPLLNTKLSP
ncbi:N-acetylmuramoyl-L-alanine amidase [Flocculibacter collagenilyticus]|uniref:N-acetylmuramoyl-L-alanine amidase n=1 Tax=Flocculibacter collagenilyticus TaxID=2744479 RepID=UPI0018F657AB|nr:N-acetylmuramoyl-L-alanine amidase [Flocculibacter collagenilyticus]